MNHPNLNFRKLKEIIIEKNSFGTKVYIVNYQNCLLLNVGTKLNMTLKWKNQNDILAFFFFFSEKLFKFYIVQRKGRQKFYWYFICTQIIFIGITKFRLYWVNFGALKVNYIVNLFLDWVCRVDTVVDKDW